MPRPDCIIVLCHFLDESGGLRNEFEVRLILAAALQRMHQQLFIIVNGGRTKGTPVAQGQAAASYLQKFQVPPEKILWTASGHDTFDELNTARKIMSERGWKMPYVISNKWQLQQVNVAFSLLDQPWEPIPSPLQVHSLFYKIERIIAIFVALISPQGKIMHWLRVSREKYLGQRI